MSRFQLKMVPLTEHQEQTDLMLRILKNIEAHPELAAVFAVPNGGWRQPAVARQMAEEGVKPGVPDLIFPMARGGYFGYFQEQKRTVEATVSKVQKAWHCWLAAQNYLIEVRRGCEDGWQGFMDYLALPPTPFVRGEPLSEVQTLEMLRNLIPESRTIAHRAAIETLERRITELRRK